MFEMIMEYDKLKSQEALMFGDTLRHIQDFKNGTEEVGLAHALHG